MTTTIETLRLFEAATVLVALLVAGCEGSSHRDDDSDGGEDTGADSDADSDVDSDADADADTDNECTKSGNFYDPVTGLCWQDPPSENSMAWYEASGTPNPDPDGPENDIDYCGDLENGGFTDWRLPYMDELVSLIRGCVDGTATGDLSRSECYLEETGWWGEGELRDCDRCVAGEGPGLEGSYRDPGLTGTTGRICALSPDEAPSLRAWFVVFFSAGVLSDQTDSGGFVRCVRGESGASP